MHQRMLVALATLGLASLVPAAAGAQIVSNSLDQSTAFQVSVLDRGQTPVISVNVSPSSFTAFRLTQDPYNPMRPVPWRYETTRDTIDATVLCPVSGHCGAANRASWKNGNVSTLTFNGAVVGTAPHHNQDVVAIPLKQPLRIGENRLVFSQRDPRTGRGTTAGGFVPGREVIITRLAPAAGR